jgi:hypothetical protein
MAISQLSNKEGNMKVKKQLIVCLTVCLALSFVATVYAAPLEAPLRSAPVTVVNPVSKPIPVTEANKYPVEGWVSSQFPGILWVTVKTLYEVPTDKRLVIEYFSCRSSGSYSTSYSCCITTGAYPGVDHCLPSTPYGHYNIAIEADTSQLPNPKAYMSAGQTVKIYAEPGTNVMASAWRQNQAIMNATEYPTDEYMYFSFSGYLIDK